MIKFTNLNSWNEPKFILNNISFNSSIVYPKFIDKQINAPIEHPV